MHTFGTDTERHSSIAADTYDASDLTPHLKATSTPPRIPLLPNQATSAPPPPLLLQSPSHPQRDAINQTQNGKPKTLGYTLSSRYRLTGTSRRFITIRIRGDEYLHTVFNIQATDGLQRLCVLCSFEAPFANRDEELRS